MHGTQWVSFITAVGIASWMGFTPVTAFSCSFGREPNPKERGIIRWVMPLNHRLRCQCTSIYPGGLNTFTPNRGFNPFYTEHPLFTDLKTEIFNYFECQNCSLGCQNGGTFIEDPCHCSCDTNWTGKECTVRRHYDCQDYYNAGSTRHGVHTIYSSKYPEGLDVFCDMDYWPGSIVIQKRFNKNLNFRRGWDEYRDGFGDIAGDNFWLGNEKVRQLTEEDDNSWELQVKIFYLHQNRELNTDNFRLSGENYTIHFDDPLDCGNDGIVFFASGMPFSTYDRDNDGDSGMNCAVESGGGWWFNGCNEGGTPETFNLNAEYSTGHTISSKQCQQISIDRSALKIKRRPMSL